MEEMEVTLEQVLNCREERAFRQRELISTYSRPVISFSMNIAGPVKTNNLIERAFRLGLRRLDGALLACRAKVLCKEVQFNLTGPQAYLCIDMTARRLKTITCRIEDRDELGRLFDMDVIDTDFSKVDRSELGFPDRRCLICGNEAKVCSSRRIHPVGELRSKTNDILNRCVTESESDLVAYTAVKALLQEVYISPKPGLVDRFNNGAHRDMDMLTFSGSAAVLYPYFKKSYLIGLVASDPLACFSKLREQGIHAEAAMFLETHGVNTHKGAVFTMGIVCAATGMAVSESEPSTESILDLCAKISAGIVERDLGTLSAKDCETSGQRLFLEHGISGIRGEMEQGLPSVLHHGLPVLERLLSEGRSWDEAGSNALLAILANITDTNMVSRGGLKRARAVTRQVGGLVSKGFVPLETIRELDRTLTSENLSPGGAADLLAVCCYLHCIKEVLDV